MITSRLRDEEREGKRDEAGRGEQCRGREEAREEGAPLRADARKRLGIPIEYGSCHTAVVDGYALEGHVPVREILRLLNERPNAIGLAVPGMPVGSPGMDGPEYGRRRDPYDVLLLTRDGTSRIFQSYR